jgi:hypothetical protein
MKKQLSFLTFKMLLTVREERSKEISLNFAIKFLRNEETVELPDVQNVTDGGTFRGTGHSPGRLYPGGSET